MPSIGSTSIARFVQDLAGRTPSPGGGTAAAVTAAIAIATGAMAARYTTGAKWGPVGDKAQLMAEALDQGVADALRLADDEVAAFEALRQARTERIAEAIAVAERRVAAIPASVLALCARHATALRGFIAIGNPHLTSDLRIAIHLLVGAGRSAWQHLLANQPELEVQSRAQAHLDELGRCERIALDLPETA